MARIFVCFIVFTQIAFGGFDHEKPGARARSLGGAVTALADDIWTIQYNPGSLVQLQSPQISFSYSPRPFGLSELSTSAVAFGMPTSFGGSAFTIQKFGFDLYKEVSLSVAFACTLSGIGLGLGLTYDHVAIQQYGSAGAFGIDIGMLANISSKFRTGLYLHNINAPTIGASKEQLPQDFAIGIAYVPVPEFHCVIDYEKEGGFDAAPRFGIEYLLNSLLALRIGASDVSSQSSCGLGLKYRWFQFDYALNHHPDLGLTHEFSVALDW